MATDKKRLTISLDDDLLEKVLQYQDDKKLKTQSSAIVQLLELGMSALGVSPVVKNDSIIEKKYAELDKYGKNAVDAILNIEHSRCAEEALPEPKKVIPLFSQSFAAGGNDNFAEDAWEDYEVPEDTKADFAIRVSGDSMEPELHDGQIYLCKKRYPEIGEICVAMVNGGFYVKQFVTDGHNIYLLSVNRARKESDIDIMETGQYTGKCLGTVIHKRIPLVEP